MKLIEEQTGTIVPVTVMKAWLETFERTDSDEVSLVVKIRGDAEDGRTGTATIWLDDEIIQKGPGKGKPRIDYEIENLKHIGMKDGDFDNLAMIEGASVDFYVSAKEKNGKTMYNYYLQIQKAKEIAPSEAKELISAIRGRAKKNMEAIGGTPVEEAKDELPMKW